MMKRISRRMAAAGFGLVVVAAGTVAVAQPASAGAAAAPANQAWGTSVSAPAGVQGVLNGVAAASSNDVVAVGAHTVDPPEAAYLRDAYAEHWDGSRWTSTAVPVPVFGQNQTSVLNAAAAAGSGDSWAVGSVSSTAGELTLAYHWNGSTWTRTPTPSPGTTKSDHLYDVAARSSSDVWAVGDYGPNPSRSLLVHWNGSTWSQVAVPNIGVLHSVSTDAGSVWVASRSTVLHLTSTGWTKLPRPSGISPSDEPVLNAIARSGAYLWAVGNRFPGGGGQIGTEAAYAAFWNGSRWTTVNPHGENALSDAVTVPGGIEATSGSQVFDITPAAATEAVTPNSAGRFTDLSAISADPAGHRWAVGTEYVSNDSHRRPGIINAPGIGQGGIVVSSHKSHSLLTWSGPAKGSLETNDAGKGQVGGLPAGSYTISTGATGCTPGAKRVTVRAGEVTTVDAPIVC